MGTVANTDKTQMHMHMHAHTYTKRAHKYLQCAHKHRTNACSIYTCSYMHADICKQAFTLACLHINGVNKNCESTHNTHVCKQAHTGSCVSTQTSPYTPPPPPLHPTPTSKNILCAEFPNPSFTFPRSLLRTSYINIYLCKKMSIIKS